MKKKFMVSFLLLGFTLCLFSSKSKDTVLTLNLKSMLFTHADHLGDKVSERDPNKLDDYLAYNGRSLTLVLTDVNPFLYRVVINGNAHEYFHDQKKFEDELNKAIGESEKQVKKTDAEIKDSNENAIDSIKNNPDGKTKSEIRKNPILQKTLEDRNINALMDEFKKPETLEDIGNQLKELIFLMAVSNVQRDIKRLHDDFKQLNTGVSKLKCNPHLGYSQIVEEFFNLVNSRFPEFSSTLNHQATIADFQVFSKNQLAILTKELDRITNDYSDLLISKPSLKNNLSGLEESIDAIEKFFQLFDECLVLFKADAFVVRQVFPTIYGDEFIIRISVFKKDGDQLEKEIQPIRIHMANGTKIDFSAGVALGINSADEEYILEKSDAADGKLKIVRNSSKLVTPTPYALVHAYPRWLGRWIKLDFFCFGVGMNSNQSLNYYFGTGISGDTKRPINATDSNNVIPDRRIVLNFGLLLTKIKTLAPRFEGMSEVEDTVTVEELLKEGYKARLFVGVSYNF